MNWRPVVQTAIVLSMVFAWKILDRAGHLSGELKAHISGILIGFVIGGLTMLLSLAAAADDEEEKPPKPPEKKTTPRVE